MGGDSSAVHPPTLWDVSWMNLCISLGFAGFYLLLVGKELAQRACLAFPDLLRARRRAAPCVPDTMLCHPARSLLTRGVPADSACPELYSPSPLPSGGVKTQRLPDAGHWQPEVKLSAAAAGRHNLPHSHEELGPFAVFIAGRAINWLSPPVKQEVFSTSSSLERSLSPDAPS